MESLTRVFGLLGISNKDKQDLNRQCDINTVQKLIDNRENLLRSKYKACHLLVAAIDFIGERRGETPPPHDDSKTHLLFAEHEPLGESWEFHLTKMIEQARAGSPAILASNPRASANEGEKSTGRQPSKDKVFRNGDVYWEDIGNQDADPILSPAVVDADELGINNPASPWKFDESMRYVVLKKSPSEVRIPILLFKKLFCFQREGVAWLAELYINDNGGILGECVFQCARVT